MRITLIFSLFAVLILSSCVVYRGPYIESFEPESVYTGKVFTLTLKIKSGLFLLGDSSL